MTELETALLDALVKERGRTAALEERVKALREQMVVREAVQSVGKCVGDANAASFGKRRQEAVAPVHAHTWNGA